jgi:hypothetical protein
MTMHTVSKGFATYYGYVMAGLAFLTVAIGQLAGDTSPLGISPALGLQIGAALAIATAVGRKIQQVKGDAPVKWDLSHTIGFGLSLISVLLLLFGEVESQTLLLGVSAATMEKISAALTMTLTLGRQLVSAFSPTP